MPLSDPFLILRTVLAVLILLFLPGYALTRALWPPGAREAPGALERGWLAVALSAALTIVIGAILGFLPHGERGFFRVPLLVGLLLAVTALGWNVGRKRTSHMARETPAADAPAPQQPTRSSPRTP